MLYKGGTMKKNNGMQAYRALGFIAIFSLMSKLQTQVPLAHLCFGVEWFPDGNILFAKGCRFVNRRQEQPAIFYQKNGKAIPLAYSGARVNGHVYCFATVEGVLSAGRSYQIRHRASIQRSNAAGMDSG